MNSIEMIFQGRNEGSMMSREGQQIEWDNYEFLVPDSPIEVPLKIRSSDSPSFNASVGELVELQYDGIALRMVNNKLTAVPKLTNIVAAGSKLKAAN